MFCIYFANFVEKNNTLCTARNRAKFLATGDWDELKRSYKSANLWRQNDH